VNGFITFGCLAPQYKLNDTVIAAWAEILCGTPRSRLVLANTAMFSEHNREHLAGRFRRAGADPERIDLLGPLAHYDFLQYYNYIDIALDTFPYNGGTTTMEALWQGVPVLTFAGDRWAARISASLLSGTHLGDFVRYDLGEYLRTAIALAQDPATPSRLESLRKSMRRRLRRCPTCDTHRQAEAFQRIIFEHFRSGFH
jgi:predicted O-linked N-acetylglucosamine transferase (SPINDLY family)